MTTTTTTTTTATMTRVQARRLRPFLPGKAPASTPARPLIPRLRMRITLDFYLPPPPPLPARSLIAFPHLRGTGSNYRTQTRYRGAIGIMRHGSLLHGRCRSDEGEGREGGREDYFAGRECVEERGRIGYSVQKYGRTFPQVQR